MFVFFSSEAPAIVDDAGKIDKPRAHIFYGAAQLGDERNVLLNSPQQEFHL